VTIHALWRRVTQLEAARRSAAPHHHVWQPDGLTDEERADWLAGLREREGWPTTDGVTIYRWAPEELSSRS